jgi:hypothetical protein
MQNDGCLSSLVGTSRRRGRHDTLSSSGCLLRLLELWPQRPAPNRYTDSEVRPSVPPQVAVSASSGNQPADIVRRLPSATQLPLTCHGSSRAFKLAVHLVAVAARFLRATTFSGVASSKSLDAFLWRCLVR